MFTNNVTEISNSSIVHPVENNADIEGIVTGGAVTGGTTDSAATGSSGSYEILKNLLAGDTFSGIIKSISDSSVSIELSNGEIISARLTDDVNIQMGKAITFMVEENTPETISLKPLIQNEQQAFFINKVLDAANMPASDSNINIVKELISLNMPVNSDMLNNMQKYTLRFPDASVNTIANLVKLDMSVTKENIVQFDAYRNFKNSINVEINQLPDAITQVVDNMISSGDAGNALDVLKNILNTLDTSAQTPYENNSRADMFSDKQVNTLAENISAFTGENTDEIITFLKNADVGKVLSVIEKGLTQLQSDSTGKSLTKLSALHKFTGSDEFRLLLGNLIDKNMKLTPSAIADEKNISSFYKKLQSRLNRISGDIAGRIPQDTVLEKDINNIKNNIDFMNDLNKNMTYFQMPLKFQNSDANGELYVFTNKKALKNNKENVSAMLHLDMENLGSVDVYVKLDGKSLSTNFCLESEDLLNFVLDNISKLTDRLNSLGYNTTYSMKVNDKKNGGFDFVNDFIQQDNHMPATSQYIFDIKA